MRLRSVGTLSLGAPPAAEGVSTLLRRLSTGLRVERAADDAAGVARAVSLEAASRGAVAAGRNAADALGLLSVVDAAQGGIIDELQRMLALAVTGSSDTLSPRDRAGVRDDFESARSGVDAIATAAVFAGRALFDGAFSAGGGSTLRVTVDGDAASAFTIDLPALRASALGLGGGTVSLASGARGITSAALVGAGVPVGTVTLSATGVAATSASLTGSPIGGGPVLAPGTLVLRVDGQTYTTSYAGPRTAAIEGATASPAEVPVSGALDLVVDGQTTRVLATAGGSAVLRGSGPIASPLSAGGALVLLVNGLRRSLTLAAPEAAVVQAGAPLAAPLTRGGDLTVEIDGQRATASFAGPTAAVLTAAAPAAAPSADGVLSFTAAGTTRSVSIAGARGASISGAGPAVLPVGSPAALHLQIDGQDVNLTLAAATGAALTGAAAVPASLTEGGTLALTVDGVARSASFAGATGAVLSGAGPAAALLSSGGTLSVAVDGLRADITVLGATAAQVSSTALPNNAKLSAAGSLTLSVDGVARTVALARNDTGANVASKISAALGAAGTATYDATTRVLSVRSATIGAASSVSITGASGFPLAELGFVPGQSAAGSNGSTPANVVAALNTALGAAGTAALDGGVLVLRSATRGASSTVEVLAGSTASVLAGLGLSAGQSSAGTDGASRASVVSALNAALGATGSAALDGGALVLRSASVGAASRVAIDPASSAALLAELGFGPGDAATGADGDGLSDVVSRINSAAGAAVASASGGVLTLTSTTVGAGASVVVGAGTDAAARAALGLGAGQSDFGADGDTVAEVVSALNAAFGGLATFSLDGGALRGESVATGAGASLAVAAGSTAGALASFGLGAADAAQGTDGDDAATVEAKLQAAIGGAGTVDRVGGALRLTSASTGAASSVRVVSASTLALASALGFSIGQADSGVDGDSAATIVSRLGALLGSDATVSLAAGALRVETTAASGAASIEVSADSDAAILADLGLSAGQSATGTAGDTLADLVARAQGALAGRGTLSQTADGRLRLETATAGAAGSVGIGAGSTAALASALGLSPGDADVGSDALGADDLLALAQAALGSAGALARDSSGRVVLRSASTGTGSSVSVQRSSTAALLDALGLTAGDADTGEAATLRVEAVHSDGTTDAADVRPGALDVRFTGALSGLYLRKSASATTAPDISAAVDIADLPGPQVDTAALARAALPTLRAALGEVTSARARAGVLAARLSHIQSLLGRTAEAATAARGRITDADLPATVTALMAQLRGDERGAVARSVAQRISRDAVSRLLASGPAAPTASRTSLGSPTATAPRRTFPAPAPAALSTPPPAPAPTAPAPGRLLRQA